jgi:hypothetical protein
MCGDEQSPQMKCLKRDLKVESKILTIHSCFESWWCAGISWKVLSDSLHTECWKWQAVNQCEEFEQCVAGCWLWDVSSMLLLVENFWKRTIARKCLNFEVCVMETDISAECSQGDNSLLNAERTSWPSQVCACYWWYYFIVHTFPGLPVNSVQLCSWMFSYLIHEKYFFVFVM